MPLAAPVTIAALSLSFMSVSCRLNRSSAKPLSREVENPHAVPGRLHFPPPLVRAGKAHVVEAAFPEPLHALARKFVILGAGRIRRPAVDEVQDSDFPTRGAYRRKPLEVRIVPQLRRELFHKPSEGMTKFLQLGHASCVESGLAGVLDVLGALEHLIEVHGQLAARVEEI